MCLYVISFFFQGKFPKKLKVISNLRNVDLGKKECLNIKKYLIPHEGNIEMLEDGTIHVITENGLKMEITKIDASSGISDEYREDLNDRQKVSEKIFNAIAGGGKKGPKLDENGKPPQL